MGGPRTEQLYLAIGQDAPGLVRPDLARWLQNSNVDPETGTPTATFGMIGSRWGDVTIFNDGSQCSGNLEEPGDFLSSVRVPLTGSLWAAEVGYGEGGLYVDGRFGSLDLDLNQDEASDLVVPQAQWALATTPLKALGPQDQLLDLNYDLHYRPLHAPLMWRFQGLDQWTSPEDGGADAQGIWHPRLPVGLPLRIETNGDSACGLWWYGFLDVSPVDPPPEASLVLRATERRGEECPPR
jgi:hypothetical protein